MPTRMSRPQEHGQILPIFAVALVLVIIPMIAVVIEAGNLMAQQRVSQNAADAGAMAGAIVVAKNLADPGATSGTEVLDRVVEAASQTASAGDDLSNVQAVYTDGFGAPIGPVTAGSAIPSEARGVNVTGQRLVDTTIARVVGINQLPASATATAVAGVRVGPCPPDQTCAVLPVTMPVSTADTICDEDLQSLGIGSPQNPWNYITDPSNPDPALMSVLPLCITGSGDFSWLDLGPDNLQQEILNPSGQSFLIPDWIRTQPGNPNSAEGEINTYQNTIVLIPMWQGICGEDPGGTGIDEICPQDPPDPNGNNTWYAIPFMRAFLLDRAYIQGDNRSDCDDPAGAWPDEAQVQGLIGCMKGWWLKTTVTGGPIDPNRPIDANAVLGVQLIK